ncbi:MAG: S1C family serine protease [Gemmataceae bacterium]
MKQQISHSFRKSSTLILAVVLGVGLLLPSVAQAQASKVLGFARNNPEILKILESVVAQPRKSVVTVRCEGDKVAFGTIVGSDGWVLTKASKLTKDPVIVTEDGNEFEAKVVGAHPKHDLALLRVKAEKFQAVAFTPSKDNPVGSWAISVGSKATPITVGVVSVGMRNVRYRKGVRRVNPNRGYMGINLAPDSDGVKILRVLPRSGASKAGLRPNDVIVAVNKKDIKSPEKLIAALSGLRPGTTVVVGVLRGKNVRDFKVKLGRAPLSRGDIQNSMGSKLSKRRTGFPIVLQHDGIVAPDECGSPVVNLDGEVIGINVSRAGRTESYAIPTEVVLPLIQEMKKGMHPLKVASGN